HGGLHGPAGAGLPPDDARHPRPGHRARQRGRPGPGHQRAAHQLARVRAGHRRGRGGRGAGRAHPVRLPDHVLRPAHDPVRRGYPGRPGQPPRHRGERPAGRPRERVRRGLPHGHGRERPRLRHHDRRPRRPAARALRPGRDPEVSRRPLVGAVLLAAAVALPAALAGTRYASYVQHVTVQVMLMGLYAMAWDFLNGYVGLFSFGHAAFFGTGAYVTAILVARGAVTAAPLALAAALAASVLVGAVVGYLASRVGSVAVFLVTFACAEALYLIVLADPRGLTNGDNGLPGVVPAPLAGVDLTDPVTFYYVALGVVVLAY